jgi:hypothetical protein
VTFARKVGRLIRKFGTPAIRDPGALFRDPELRPHEQIEKDGVHQEDRHGDGQCPPPFRNPDAVHTSLLGARAWGPPRMLDGPI